MAGEKKETIKNASMFLFILGIRGTSEKRKRWKGKTAKALKEIRKRAQCKTKSTRIQQKCAQACCPESRRRGGRIEVWEKLQRQAPRVRRTHRTSIVWDETWAAEEDDS